MLSVKDRLIIWCIVQYSYWKDIKNPYTKFTPIMELKVWVPTYETTVSSEPAEASSYICDVSEQQLKDTDDSLVKDLIVQL